MLSFILKDETIFLKTLGGGGQLQVHEWIFTLILWGLEKKCYICDVFACAGSP